MKVAITGSSGFLASGLMPVLARAGHEIVRVVRPQTDASGIPWDPVAGTIDRGAFEGIDAVVHLAGVGIGDRRWTDRRKRQLVRSRVDATALIATTLASLSRKPGVLVSASAIGYYGDRGVQLIDEDSGPGHGFLADLCRRWEDATRPAADAGIRVVRVRTGIVLGHDGALFKRLVPMFKLGLGGRIGDGTHYQSWITRDDHARAVSWSLDAEVSGPVNLTAPEPVTNSEFTRALAASLHRPAALAVPRFGIAAVLGRELASELLASQRVVPARLSQAGFSFLHPTLASGLAALFP